MTDELNSPTDTTCPTSPARRSGEHGSPEPPAANGAAAAQQAPAVRSGLAHRRNPALATLGELAQGARRMVFRDPIALFLVIASIALAIAFATLLGDIKPSSAGTQAPLSTVQKLAKRHDVSSALLLDHDSRVEIATTTAAPPLSPAGVLPPLTRRTVRTHVKGSKKIKSARSWSLHPGPALSSSCGPPIPPRAR